MTPGLKNLAGQWSAVLGGAFGYTDAAGNRKLLNTQQTASLIQNAQIAAGVTPGGYTMGDLTKIRSTAVSWRRSADTIAAADDLDPLTPQAIALAPWSRALAERDLAPAYEVRYEMLIASEEGITSQWLSIGADVVGLPSSIGALRDLVQQQAEDTSNDGGSPPFEAGQSFHGVGNILVVAV